MVHPYEDRFKKGIPPPQGCEGYLSLAPLRTDALMNPFS